MEGSRLQKQQIQQPTNSQKVQQNSYPFYAPKVGNKSRPENNGETQRPVSNQNGANQPKSYPMSFKPSVTPKQDINNTFTNYSVTQPPPPYRRS